MKNGDKLSKQPFLTRFFVALAMDLEIPSGSDPPVLSDRERPDKDQQKPG